MATIPTGAPVTGVWNLALVAMGVTMLAASRASPRTWDMLTLWPMILILSAYALGCVVSVDPNRSLARFAGMPLFALVFVAVQVAAFDRRAMRATLCAGLLATLAIVIDVAMAKFAGRSLFQGSAAATTRVAGSQGNPNDLASASLLMPLAWPLLPEGALVLSYLGVAAVDSSVWILSAGRQVAIGWGVASAVPLLGRLGRWRGLVVACLVCVAVALVVATNPVLRARLQETLDAGLADRKGLFAFGLWQWWQRPWFGNGPGTYGELHLQAVMNDWSWHGMRLERQGMPWPHNVAIEVLCDLGVVGAAAFLCVAVGFTRRVRAARTGGASERRLGTAALAMMLAFVAVGLVDLTFIKDWVRIVFWMALGMGFASTRARRPGDVDGIWAESGSV